VRRNDEDRAELARLAQAQADKDRDIDRLRKTLGAVTGQGPATPTGTPFVARLIRAEDELERLRDRVHQLEKSRQGWTEALRASLRVFAAR
jgi:hypothetical protein